jgi:hypothetical protein
MGSSEPEFYREDWREQKKETAHINTQHTKEETREGGDSKEAPESIAKREESIVGVTNNPDQPSPNQDTVSST